MENDKLKQEEQCAIHGVMGSISTVHYKCHCGWKGTIKDFGGDYRCPKCKCTNGLSIYCP